MPSYRVGLFSFRRSSSDRSVWEVLAPDGKTVLSTHRLGKIARSVCEALSSGELLIDNIGSFVPSDKPVGQKRASFTKFINRFPTFAPMDVVQLWDGSLGVIYRMSQVGLPQASVYLVDRDVYTTVGTPFMTLVVDEKSVERCSFGLQIVDALIKKTARE